MVPLSLVLEQAKSGELDSVSKKDKTDRKIIAYINLALVALYNRFPLGAEEAIITLRPDIPKTIYTMDSSDPDVRVGGQPMPDGQFKSVLSAWNEDGSEISVNDEKSAKSIFTVAYNKLQIPLLGEHTYVSVIYRVNPSLVVYETDGNGDTIDKQVPIPMQLLEAMLHYIGYRAHGAVNGEINAENSTHFTRYLNACDMAEKMGILTADDVVMNAIERGGYV